MSSLYGFIDKLARSQSLEPIFAHTLALYYRITRAGKQFTFQNKQYSYLQHPYNITYFGERTVEVPIFLEILKTAKAKRVLEVGNVLSHYTKITHDVVDKYEKAKGVINLDIVTYRPKKKYDLIFSISTLEHIGWDEEPKDPTKIVRAMTHVKSMLAPAGLLIASLPLGYNPHVDKLLFQNKLGFTSHAYLRRISKDNEWREVTKKEVKGARYNSPYPYANGLVIAVFNKR